MKTEHQVSPEGLLVLVQRAVRVLQRHAPPGGLSDHAAMSEMYSIFDGPEYRAAMGEEEA